MADESHLVDKICDEFEAGWQDGHPPEIRSWIDQGSEADRESLVRELLTIELEYRIKRGEEPAVREYSELAELCPEAVQTAFADAHRTDSKTRRSNASDHAAEATNAQHEAGLPQLGDYEIIEVIGHGGMGVVYRARQVSANREVALKLVRGDGLEIGSESSTEAGVRIRREAKAAAQLSHDHIVQVFDVGEANGHPYFSMQLIEGQSLAHKLADGPLSDRVAAKMIEPVCRAVQYSHEHGILHRDIKPSNILITEDDRPYVSDFGLAKTATDDQTLTQIGDLIGTAMYMAPEQTNGAENCTVASDVYSIGATLYEMITGRPTFRGTTVLETIMLVMKQLPVSPREFNSGIHKDIETITLKCLEKEPAKRYATAGELADDLRRFLNNEPVLARPIGWLGRTRRWSRRHPGIATLLMLLMVVIGSGLGGVLWMWREAVAARDHAVERSLAATQARIAESHAKQTAIEAQRTTQQEVARLQTTTGLQLLEDNRLIESLTATNAALQLYEQLESDGRLAGESDIASAHARNVQRQRRRLAATVRFSPRLISTWKLPPNAVRLVDRSYRDGNLLGVSFAGEHLIFTHAAQGNGKGVGLDHPEYHPMRFDVRSGKPIPFGFDIHAFERVQVSPDGRWAFTFEREKNQVSLRDVIEGTVLRSAEANSQDALTLLQWDTSKQLWPFPLIDGRFGLSLFDDEPVYSPLVISRDGQRGAIQRIWDMQVWDFDERKEWRRPCSDPGTPVFTRAGKLVVAAHQGYGIFVWDVEAHRDFVLEKAHDTHIVHLQLDRFDRWLLAVSRDHDGRVYRLQDLMTSSGMTKPAANGITTTLVSNADIRPVAEVAHSGGWQSISFAPDGDSFLAMPDNHTVQVIETASGKPLGGPLPHPSRISIARWDASGERVIVIGSDGVVRVWTLLPTDDQVAVALDDRATVVRFSNDGRQMATGSLAGTCQVWNPINGVSVGRAIEQQEPVVEIEWNSFGDRLAIVCGEETGRRILRTDQPNVARVWDLATAEPRSPTFGWLGYWVGAGDVGFRPGSDELGIQFRSRVAFFKHPATKTKTIVYHPGSTQMFGQLPFSPDGQRFATVSADRLLVWDARTGKQQTGFAGPTHFDTYMVKFSPDSRLVAAAGSFGVRVWDCEVERLVMDQREGLVGSVQSIAFNDTGTLLLSIRTDGEGRVWNLETGHQIGPLWTAGGETVLADFCMNSDRAVTVRRSGEIRIWDLPTGEPLTPRWQHGSTIRDADFDSNFCRLATAGDDGMVRVWPLAQTFDTKGLDDAVSEQVEIVHAILDGKLSRQAGSHSTDRDDSLPNSIRFHINQAQRCRTVNNPLGAEFHLARTAAIEADLGRNGKPIDAATTAVIEHIRLRELQRLGKFDGAVPIVAFDRLHRDDVDAAEVAVRVKKLVDAERWTEALAELIKRRAALPDDPVTAIGVTAVASTIHQDAVVEQNENEAILHSACQTLLSLCDGYPSGQQGDKSPLLIRLALLPASNDAVLVAKFWDIHRHLKRNGTARRQALIGGLHYRLGLFESAATKLHESLVSNSLDEFHTAWARCFLAMALHRLDKIEQANAILRAAVNQAGTVPMSLLDSTGLFDGHGFAAIEMKCLLSEATKVLKSDSRSQSRPPGLWIEPIRALQAAAQTQGWRTRARLADVLELSGRAEQAEAERSRIVNEENGGQTCGIFSGLTGASARKFLPMNGLGTFTAEAWIKDWNGPVFLQGLHWREQTGSENAYSMRVSQGTVQVGWNWVARPDWWLEHQLSGSEDWYHVAEVFNGTKHWLFMNGELVAQRTPEPIDNLRQHRPLLIGKYSDGDTATGLMRSLRITKRAIYKNEARFTPPQQLHRDEDTLLLLDFTRAASNGGQSDRLLDGRDQLISRSVTEAVKHTVTLPSIALGDFNGDGHMDKATGHPDAEIALAWRAGEVRIDYGNGQPSQVWSQANTQRKAEPGDEFGFSIATGDFNGDGIDDLLVGVPYEDVNGYDDAGIVQVIYGTRNGLTGNGLQRFDQRALGAGAAPERRDRFGLSVASGDFNGDGFDDVAIGSPHEAIGNKTDAGLVNVLYGSKNGLSSSGSQGFHQDSPGVPSACQFDHLFGSSLAVGDFDGDGIDDLAAGIMGETVDGKRFAGAVMIFTGGRNGLTPTDKQYSKGSSGLPGTAIENDQVGSALAVGDFNADGIDDLTVHSKTGASRLIGSRTGLQAVKPQEDFTD